MVTPGKKSDCELKVEPCFCWEAFPPWVYSDGFLVVVIKYTHQAFIRIILTSETD